MPRRPAQPGLDRRQRILEAALEVFADEGFDGATTKAIAARADVTPGLIYFYFPSKEELFQAVADHNGTVLLEGLRLDELRAAEAPPQEIIPQLIERCFAVMDMPLSGSLARVLMRSEMRADERVSHTHLLPVKQLGGSLAQALEVYCERQRARGAIRPISPWLVAHVIATSMMMLLMRRVKADTNVTGDERDQLRDQLTSMFLSGIQPEPPALEPRG